MPRHPDHEPLEHGWRSREDWFWQDRLIRGLGFIIAYRPKRGPDLWRGRDGDLWSHERALELAMGAKKKAH